MKGYPLGHRVTERPELERLRQDYAAELSTGRPFVHDFPGQGRFLVIAARPYDARDYATASVWILQVKPVDGPPTIGRGRW